MDRLVSTEWLEKQLGSSDLRVLDCTVDLRVLPEGGVEVHSGRDAWEQDHIPGSQHVDLRRELSDAASPVPMMMPAAQQFAAVMGRVGVGDGCRVVLYDSRMNMWAARVWWMLRAFGFADAAVLDGGWRAWSTETRPTTRGQEPPAPPSTFVTRPHPGLFTAKESVLAALDQPQVCILSALDRDAHSGSVITYCGGAIAASSDAFALGLLGFHDVAICDGSMTEWAADPALPLVVDG
jgi:thiosulfate/3-mercaptopyruvate sulfurtransferase